MFVLGLDCDELRGVRPGRISFFEFEGQEWPKALELWASGKRGPGVRRRRRALSHWQNQQQGGCAARKTRKSLVLQRAWGQMELHCKNEQLRPQKPLVKAWKWRRGELLAGVQSASSSEHTGEQHSQLSFFFPCW